MDETEFSDGNMGRTATIYNKEQDFFGQIPFNLVFHDGRFPPENRDTIVFHRHAEVLVPNRLRISPSLRIIACRSAAERQTLLHLLPINLRRRWNPRIRIADLDLFERRWTFVEEVVVVDDSITFRFNPSTSTPGPFQVRVIYSDSATGVPVNWEGQVTTLNSSWRIRVPNASSGEASLFLDDALAFSDNIFFSDLPF